MRRFVTAVLLVVGVLALTNAAVADPGDNGQGKKQGKNRFTFILTTADNGSCDTTGRHGHTVRTGIKGKFEGYLVGTVKATSFNTKATCVVACFTDTFLATFFTGAEFSCLTNSTDCKFNFTNTAKAKQQNVPKLRYRHWQDKGKGAGTMLKEEFKGDIANS